MMGSEDNSKPLAPGSAMFSSNMLDSVMLDEDAGEGPSGSQDKAGGPLAAANLEGLVNLSVDDDHLGEPPSYADATFMPYARQAGASDESPSSSSKEFLQISVTDTHKVIDSTGGSLVPGTSHVEYTLITRTNTEGFSAQHLKVNRRFRDFVALSDRLAVTQRGYFIPPRPDKAVIEGQTMQEKDFVEARRMALEKYLRRLASHPVLRHSEELHTFLESDGQLPLAASVDLASRMLDGAAKLPRQLFGSEHSTPAPKEAAQPAKGGRDLLRIFKELKQTVSNDWTSSKPPIVEEDKDFLDWKEKALDMEKQLTNASAKAEALTKAFQELGESMGELGLTFQKISQFEAKIKGATPPQQKNAVDLRRVGHGAMQMKRWAREATSASVQHLGALHEHLGLMAALHAAVADRSQALLTVQTLTSDVTSRKGRIEKLEASSAKLLGGDKSQTRKIAELKSETDSAESALEAARQVYDTIKRRNHEEMERSDAERQSDLHDMLSGFVDAQIAYAERTSAMWSNIVEDFKSPGRPSRPGESLGRGNIGLGGDTR